MKHDNYLAMLSKALKRGGDLYTFDDIMEAIHTGDKQSFSHNQSWVVTEVHDFPRRRTLDVLLLVGDNDDFDVLHAKVMKFAEEVGATLVRAFGRSGWTKYAEANGWKVVDTVYYKDLLK